jgi:flavin-binding protein dodecin
MPAFHREISRAAAAFAGDCGLVFANCVPQRLGPPLRRLSPPSVPGFAFALNKEAAPESGLKGLGMLLCVWENQMPDSVYKVIELIGTSTASWEDAAKNAVERASQSLRDLRVAEVVELDMQLDNGKVEAYRAKVNVSFKYEGGG